MAERLASILILSGPPGAGKSTVADILAMGSAQPSVHLHTDDFCDRYIKSGYVLPWLPDAQKQNETVAKVIAAAAVEYALGGYFTIIDGVVGPWFLEPYRQAARTRNVVLNYAVLRPASADSAVARVQQRRTHGLKAEGPVRELYRQFAELGALESHVVDSSAPDVQAIAAHLKAMIARGALRLR
ncbi:MAG TPA: AAA family ATPase [Rhizomicrobium sp.]